MWVAYFYETNPIIRSLVFIAACKKRKISTLSLTRTLCSVGISSFFVSGPYGKCTFFLLLLCYSLIFFSFFHLSLLPKRFFFNDFSSGKKMDCTKSVIAVRSWGRFSERKKWWFLEYFFFLHWLPRQECLCENVTFSLMKKIKKLKT